MGKSALITSVLGIAIGLVLSLIVGTGVSYLPDSLLEGFYTGTIVSSVLFVASLALLFWIRGSGSPKQWLFGLHSFLGLATGVILLIIVISGVLLLFRGEIEAWSHDWMKVQPRSEVASIDAWLDTVSTKVTLNNTNRIDVAWPKSLTAPVEIRVSGPEGSKKFYVDPYRAVLLEGEVSTWMDWVRELHGNLHLGSVGGYLLGLACLGMAWLVITGLLVRPRLFRDWRVLRFNMGSRIFVGDLHKRLGAWLFPFVFLYALSGMLLIGLFSAGPMRIAFDGNSGNFYKAKGYPLGISRSEQADMPSLVSLTQIANRELPDAKVRGVSVFGFGDRDALVSVQVKRQGGVIPRVATMHIHAQTKNILYFRRTEDMGMFERIYEALVAFHVADLNIPAIRILYAGASIGFILLPILGVVMWIQRCRESQ